MSDEPEPTPGDLVFEAAIANESAGQRLDRLRRELEEELAHLSRLEEKRKRTRLSDPEFLTILRLENNIGVLLIEIQELEPVVRYEQADIAITEASVAHDHGVPLTRDAAQEIVACIAALHHAMRRFEQVYTAQHTPLEGLVHANGEPLFLDMPTARAAAERLVIGLPHGSDLAQYLFANTAHPPTVGEARAAMGAVHGCTPLSPRLITRFLAGYKPEEQAKEAS